ncbi:MAG: hypothetical protein SFT91_03775 [Rickettsiaceae bacterium]|nr:hypothetical protein [Rickettsiaceae bacterium]
MSRNNQNPRSNQNLGGIKAGAIQTLQTSDNQRSAGILSGLLGQKTNESTHRK